MHFDYNLSCLKFILLVVWRAKPLNHCSTIITNWLTINIIGGWITIEIIVVVTFQNKRTTCIRSVKNSRQWQPDENLFGKQYHQFFHSWTTNWVPKCLLSMNSYHMILATKLPKIIFNWIIAFQQLTCRPTTSYL